MEERVLDLSGLMCPLPVVMTSQQMNQLKEGDILKVISTDPGFERDIYNWCMQTGHLLLALHKEDGKVIARIQKTSQSQHQSLWYWVKFHALGVKLHARYYLTVLNPFVEKPDHFITFVAISEGLRAEKMVGKRAKLLPIPDEIDPRCGVVLAVKGRDRAVLLYKELSEAGVGVEAIYSKEGKDYRRIYP
ncbi:SirA family protein [Thermocrinis albus DSM 14484]|uniref:SirA family protein n=1 Tax=Thermocrinis albus (strain DSM 14484 / JCM 11386 / HI 11/12) TaxID=638303 RepID=D3SLR0_THEAH|nr:sulfurtransferase TusA family protein [Thermocrinis albus]ADC89690.1 SirA family protein [Thermocrinis albus DSM 14484]